MFRYPASALAVITLLAACEPAPPVSRDLADMEFMGSWNCGVTVMTFTPEYYLPANEADPIPIRRFDISGREVRITLMDGAEMSVMTNGDRQMSWLSHTTGDTFDCTRVAG